MFDYINRIIGTLKRNSPYGLPSETPKELKTVWIKRLLNASVSYWVIYLFSVLIWKPWFYILVKTGKSELTKNLSPLEKKKVLRLALRDHIEPFYYWYFNFREQGRYKKRHSFLYHSSLVHCLKYLEKSPDVRIIHNKLIFHQYCLNRHIPTPKNYAFTKDLKFEWTDIKPWEYALDFIIKPVQSSKGRGFSRFLYDDAHNAYFSSLEDRYIPVQLIEKYLTSVIYKSGEDFLIQQRLINHPQVDIFCNDALACVRILSVVDKNGNIRMFRPVFKMPQGKAILNYLHTGALVSQICLETGKLRKLLGFPTENNKYHPEKEILLEGRELPYWKEIKQLVISLHQSLPLIPLIGWDIAVTPTGPVFLEGNINPALDIHQMQPFTPFIPSEFYDLLLYHFQN